MSKQVIVPFGPQHPVLPEPIHLDLVLEDERVVEAIPSIGYILEDSKNSSRNANTQNTSTLRSASAGFAVSYTAVPTVRPSRP